MALHTGRDVSRSAPASQTAIWFADSRSILVRRPSLSEADSSPDGNAEIGRLTLDFRSSRTFSDCDLHCPLEKRWATDRMAGTRLNHALAQSETYQLTRWLESESLQMRPVDNWPCRTFIRARGYIPQPRRRNCVRCLIANWHFLNPWTTMTSTLGDIWDELK